MWLKCNGMLLVSSLKRGQKNNRRKQPEEEEKQGSTDGIRVSRRIGTVEELGPLIQRIGTTLF